MSKAIHENNTAITTVAGDNFTEPVDITNFNGIAYQFTGGATATGTLTIQKTVNGSDWVDTAFTQALSGGKGLVESGATLIMAAKARLKINIATNPGASTYYSLAKEV